MRGPSDGATGWSYDEVLPYFRKSEGLVAGDDMPIDAAAHGTDGPLGVAVRSPVLPGAQAFVDAAVAAGIPAGDYNGRDRGGPAGLVSLLQTTTVDGKRSSTYHAFLEGEVEAASQPDDHHRRPGHPHRARGRARRAAGDRRRVRRRRRHDPRRRRARREVVLSAGAVGSPQLLMLSGIGPREQLESRRHHLPGRRARGRSAPQGPPAARVDVPPRPGSACRWRASAWRWGPMRCARRPARCRPTRPTTRRCRPSWPGSRPRPSASSIEWFTTGRGLVSSSLYDASAWLSTGLGDPHTHDAQIALFACGYNADIWRGCLRVDPNEYFADPAATLAPEAESMIVLANPVQPHSEGEIRLASADPLAAPDIRMNYFGDPHDMAVMIARRAPRARHRRQAARRPRDRRGARARPHSPPSTDTPPGAPFSDELIEDLARHYSSTVYHLDEHLPDRLGRRPDAARARRRRAARRGCQRHAQRGQRQHERRRRS